MNPQKSSAPESVLRDFIARNLLYNQDGFPYSDQASFLQEGIIDSLGVVELVDFIEKKFGVRAEPQEITPEHFDSVTRLAAFIRRKQELKAVTERK
jgi:acyl carrier protein